MEIIIYITDPLFTVNQRVRVESDPKWIGPWNAYDGQVGRIDLIHGSVNTQISVAANPYHTNYNWYYRVRFEDGTCLVYDDQNGVKLIPVSD